LPDFSSDGDNNAKSHSEQDESSRSSEKFSEPMNELVKKLGDKGKELQATSPKNKVKN